MTESIDTAALRDLAEQGKPSDIKDVTFGYDDHGDLQVGAGLILALLDRLEQDEVLAETHALCAERLSIETEYSSRVTDDRAYWHEVATKAKDQRDAAIARAERAEAVVAAIRAVLFKRYTGSPGYERTPEHVKEIDAIRDLYGEELAASLVAALDTGKEKDDE